LSRATPPLEGEGGLEEGRQTPVGRSEEREVSRREREVARRGRSQRESKGGGAPLGLGLGGEGGHKEGEGGRRSGSVLEERESQLTS
jgi:hypothetical protein